MMQTDSLVVEKRIAVFFPGNFSVTQGMGRTAGLFCNALLDADPGYRIVLGCNSDADAIAALVSGENVDRFLVKDIHWLKIKDSSGQVWVRPHSFFEYDYMDCDVWIFFSTPTDGTITPLKPYAIFCPDLLVRIVPEAAGTWNRDQSKSGWARYRDHLLSLRNANLVFSTTPRTVEDVVGFAGAPRWRVELAPYFAAVPATATKAPCPALPFDRYFLWTTNITPHKNHYRALLALEKYYLQHTSESLPVVVVGVDTEMMDPQHGRTGHRYTDELQNLIAQSDVLRRNVYFIGSLQRPTFEALMINAVFLWHNVIYDNGTACVLEAAELGVPSLSSDYPQMRFFDKLFGTEAHFFSAYDIDASADALFAMTQRAQASCFKPNLKLPSNDPFKQWIVDKIAALCGQEPGGAFDTTAHSLDLLTKRATSRIWPDSALYLYDFPWAEVPVVALLVESTSQCAIEGILGLLQSMLREKYLNFKVVMALPTNPMLVTATRRFVTENVLMFDMPLDIAITAQDDLEMLIDGADIAVLVSSSEEVDLLISSSIAKAIEKSRATTSFIVPAETLINDPSSDALSQFLSSIEDTLNRIQSRVAAQQSTPVVRRRALIKNNFEPLPLLPSRIHSSDRLNDFLCVSGFYDWEGKFRWVAKEALLIINVNGSVLSINAVARDVFFIAGAPRPELTIYVNEVFAGTITMIRGRQDYHLLLPSELKFIGRSTVRLVSSVVAPSKSPGDRRMLSWAMFEIAVVSGQPRLRDKLLFIARRFLKRYIRQRRQVRALMNT